MSSSEASLETAVRTNRWSYSVAFVVAVLLLAAAAESARRSTRRLVDADRRSAEAYARMTQLGAVLDAATDAETGSRGYVITGDSLFLIPYNHALATVAQEMRRLDSLYLTDTLRRPLVEKVRSAVTAQGGQMSTTVETRRVRGAAAAARIVASGRGRVLTDSVRAAIKELVDDERATLTRERAEVQIATAAASRTLIAESALGLVLFALAFAAMARESQRRRAAMAQVRELNRTLEQRVEAVRADLAQSEARLRHALDGLMEGCALFDADLRYLYTNPSSARQGRTTVEAMMGRTLLEVYPGSEESALVAAMRSTLAQQTLHEVELEFAFPDGGSGWFELHMQPVPQGLFVLSFETTDRVKAERARSESEGRLRALLASLPEHVFVLNREGVVLDVHTPSDSAPLAPAHELRGRPLVEFLETVPAERMATALRVASDTGANQQLQYEITQDTRRRHFEAVVVPTEGDRMTVVIRDITVRSNLEEQLRQAQKMEAVGQLTGGIAHDFNNVLTIIGSNAELLAGAGAPGVADSLELREIQLATRRGAEMIARLLMFSRRGLLTRERAELRAVIRDFSTMLSRLIPANIRLEIGPLEANENVQLDSGALEQVLANLCTNARDAMPDGGTLRIDCHSTWLDAGYHATHPWVKPGPYLCVTVSDSGMGMDDATRDRIFEPFFTTKPTGVGTGLGMSMVYGMMKEHGGMVHVYSEPGKGTVVKLYFPVTQESPSAEARRRISSPTSIAGGDECLLVAEDEPSIRLATRRALMSKGYEVLDAADGEQALSLWRANRARVSLVISDLVMPNLGGLQLAQALRAEGSNVPVIFTSGYSSEAVHRDGAIPPDVQFLHKPWTLAQLFASVRSVLDTRDPPAGPTD